MLDERSLEHRNSAPKRIHFVRRQRSDENQNGNRNSNGSGNGSGNGNSESTTRRRKHHKTQSATSQTGTAANAKATSSRKGRKNASATNAAANASAPSGMATPTSISLGSVPTNQAAAKADTSSSSSNVGGVSAHGQIAIIVGAVLGGVALIAALAGLILYLRGRRQDRKALADARAAAGALNSTNTSSTSFIGPPAGARTLTAAPRYPQDPTISPFPPPSPSAGLSPPGAEAPYTTQLFDPRYSRSVYDDDGAATISDGMEEKVLYASYPYEQRQEPPPLQPHSAGYPASRVLVPQQQHQQQYQQQQQPPSSYHYQGHDSLY